jgi:hypothetical protein
LLTDEFSFSVADEIADVSSVCIVAVFCIRSDVTCDNGGL